MFTGIISELGHVGSIDEVDGGAMLSIDAPDTTDALAVGDSVAVNGVCLTATTVAGNRFTATAVGETLRRTALGDLVRGSVVNLERPMSAAGRFDGHIVQGHVDGVGRVSTMQPEGDSTRIRISFPAALAPYVVEKGSICVDGTSLTVTDVSPPEADAPHLEFVAIPHTLEVTTLGTRKVGDRVNLEVDVIAKYVQRMMETRR